MGDGDAEQSFKSSALSTIEEDLGYLGRKLTHPHQSVSEEKYIIPSALRLSVSFSKIPQSHKRSHYHCSGLADSLLQTL